MLRASFALVVVLAQSGCANNPGALADNSWDGNKVTIGHSTDIGVPVSFGGPMMLINPTDDRVIITAVSIDQLDDQLTFLGWTLRDVRADDAGRVMATGVSEPFPPSDASQEVDAVVQRSTRRNADGELVGDQELVIGLSLTAPGTSTATGARITYRDARGEHDLVFPLTAVLCGPRTDFANGCERDDETED